MIGQVPIAKFESSELQGVLTNCLLHRCLDVILANLKECSVNAQMMLDPAGRLRNVRTFLAAYIADLPEQQALACVASNYAPSSVAGPTTLGDSAPQPLRRGSDTLRAIEAIMESLEETTDQINITGFRKLARERSLNGVDKPFWRDWLYADPSLFLAPDALHQWHKLFQDHPIEWAKRWLGSPELDRRLSVLQPRVGFRHFRNGFTRFRQHTGKETKDVERVFLGVIAGHLNVSSGILKAMRAFLDFVYLAQYDSHSTATLGYLEEALRKFHSFKQHIADSGVRNGPRQNGKFHIPKIELMQHVKRLIELLGSAPQFSSEQTERCHIDMAKIPYKATNRKAYAEQMCRYLDRKERMRLFSALVTWHSASDGTMLSSITAEQRKKAFQQLAGLFLPAAVRNVFERKTALCSDTTAFQLRKKPNYAEASIDEMQELFCLRNFREDLRTYFLSSRARQDMPLPFSSLSIWDRMRVQLKDPQDRELVLPALTIVANPHGEGSEDELGRFNFVLLHGEANSEGLDNFGIRGECYRVLIANIFTYRLTCPAGCTVAQLRMIFVPNFADDSTPRIPFVYVQPLKYSPRSKGMVDADVNMFSFIRTFRSNGTRMGLVVPLNRVWRPVELIPKFYKTCDKTWTCDSAVELATEFYLNCFSDKATYIEVY